MTIENLEPKLLWKHFAALSAIPRGSKNEAAAAAYVLAEAKRMGLPAKKDAVGNVIVTKPASPGRENAPVLVLQGHLDMVCEKNEATVHDFTKDGIKLLVNGEWLHADGTTLGADNGIGAAAALAVLESANIKHGPIEALFTIDEETGMTGAFGLDKKALKGTMMLNLDTEEEGAVYIGCAGGMDSVAKRKFKPVPSTKGKKALRIKVTGLKGGHSGLEIATGLGNAHKILARALKLTMDTRGLELVSFDGGSKRNAIPREAFAIVYCPDSAKAALKKDLAKLEADCRAELGAVDPGLEILVEPVKTAATDVMKEKDARILVDFLHGCLHGTLAMTPGMPELVQTSTNLAIVETAKNTVTVSMSHRSSIESAKRDVGAMIKGYCEMAGFQIEQGTGYPGWKPNLDSKLLASAKEIHKELFRVEPHVKAVHAGLECGLIGEKFPRMDMISFGPTIMGAHSPTERVNIKSVESFWKYLVRMLEKL